MNTFHKWKGLGFLLIIHSITHSLTHTLTHSLTHSFTDVQPDAPGPYKWLVVLAAFMIQFLVSLRSFFFSFFFFFFFFIFWITCSQMFYKYRQYSLKKKCLTPIHFLTLSLIHRLDMQPDAPGPYKWLVVLVAFMIQFLASFKSFFLLFFE